MGIQPMSLSLKTTLTRSKGGNPTMSMMIGTRVTTLARNARHAARRALSAAAPPPPPAAEAAVDDSAPAMTQVYGGLKDQDRIFSNIYGDQDWRIKDAEKRGDWHRTKELMWLGPDGIVNEIKVSAVDFF